MELLNRGEPGQARKSPNNSSYSSYRDSMSAKQQQIRQRLQIAGGGGTPVSSSPAISNLDADNIPAIDEGDMVADDSAAGVSSPSSYQQQRTFTFQTINKSNSVYDSTNLYQRQVLPRTSHLLDRDNNSHATPTQSSQQEYISNQARHYDTRHSGTKPTDSAATAPKVFQSAQTQRKVLEHSFNDDDEDDIITANVSSTSRSRSKEPQKPIRKPHYSALLRAHDSIRLKSSASRPVRSRSSNADYNDSADDDDMNNMTYDSSSRTRLKPTKGDLTNERAIDVRRIDDGEDAQAQNVGHTTTTTTPAKDSRHYSEVRVVRVSRNEQDSSFGVTVRAEDGHIVVARIMAGGLVDRQGLLQVGDIILAVDGHDVYTPEQLQEQLRKSSNDVTLKIVPSYRDELPTLCVYLRAMFGYDPNEDTLLPCREVGVAFQQGDILEVVNQEDPNWWQARRVESDNMQTGLIPSQELEERRRAFILPDFDYATRTSICGTKVSRKRKKEIYNIGQNSDFDRAELQLYEEVCRTPAFERRTLVLIGANGVGRQSLKARLIAFDPDRFGAPLPHTSRPMRDGEVDGLHYHFVGDREDMAQDIVDGKYLEWGEHDSHFYGTKFDSIRQVIGAGKMCILDCSATCLKVLKTPDYLPFVVFIGAPTLDQLRFMSEWNKSTASAKNYSTLDRALSRQSRRARTLQSFAFDFFEEEDLQVTIEESARLLRIYENYFDLVLVNSNFEKTFEQLKDAVDALSTEPQWIPISWIYGS